MANERMDTGSRDVRAADAEDGAAEFEYLSHCPVCGMRYQGEECPVEHDRIAEG